MIRTALKALGKITVSGIIALVILTLFSHFYYNTPTNSINKDGSTNYRRTANVFYSQGREGFGWGKTNNEGFANMFDYSDDLKIDILIMGSSHMEAYQVDMSQSTASKLNALLEDKVVYNIGVTGHHFLTCARNLKAALNKYHPIKYVVIETSSESFSDEDIAFVINEGTVQLENHEIGIRGLLRRNSYLRLINKQIQDYGVLTVGGNIEEAEDIEVLAESDTANDKTLLNELLHKMSRLAEEYGVKLIIVYHPSISIASDGSFSLNTDQNALIRFKQSCDVNGVLFLDMSDRFKEEYESSYTLPYGFANSPVGSGHLNKYGHAMMADELYQLILEDEQ